MTGWHDEVRARDDGNCQSLGIWRCINGRLRRRIRSLGLSKAFPRKRWYSLTDHSHSRGIPFCMRKSRREARGDVARYEQALQPVLQQVPRRSRRNTPWFGCAFFGNVRLHPAPCSPGELRGRATPEHCRHPGWHDQPAKFWLFYAKRQKGTFQALRNRALPDDDRIIVQP